jgi:aminopeptidase N
MLTLLLLLQTAAPPTPAHDVRNYEITLVPADTGTHLLGEVQTIWRLRTAEPVAALLDSSMRVVRVLVDGKPNTRLSRTMYGRSGADVMVPHEKQAGDTLSTRIRYHGFVQGDAWIGNDKTGARAFVAGGWKGSAYWLPMPSDPKQRATATFNIQAPISEKAIANGVLVKIDTLPYEHATWHYRLDSAAPVPALGAAVGRYAVIPVASPVEVWARPADSAWGAPGPEGRAGGRAGELMDHLSGELGAYPYPRLVHVAVPAVPAPRSGGGLVFYPEDRFRSGGIDESTMARATALQWFDGVDSSVAAGIADYLAADWLGRTKGLKGEAEEITALRKKLGDEKFWAALRSFSAGQRAGKGSAEDFAAAMQQGK